MFFQINTQIVLKSAFLAILALSSGKFVGEHSRAAQALRIFRCTVGAIGVLALLLLLSLVLLATITIIMGSALGGIVRVSFIGRARLRCDMNAIPD